MLEVEGVTKRFGEVEALGGIGFQLRPNEILGLIGPNGSGKTTLMEVVSGLLPTDSGSVHWEGSHLPPKKRKDIIFYLPDGVLPYEDQAAIKVLRLFAEIYESPSQARKLAVEELGLGPVLGKRVGALSKGYRRRLLLALALLSTQPVLFLDEPFDGFDVKQVIGVMSLLRKVKSTGRTLFLSIHQLHDAERMCERLLLLSGGRLLGTGTLPDLRRQAGLESGDLEEVFLALT